ncbi:MAG TPA: inositol monophosphatase family protein [Bryobacteraceae bacterium]|nr:inositol monophosphatase family protein [Bryobacteraceae bacterium]
MPSFLETSAEIAREAGALLHKFFLQHVAIELKGEYDVVTVADRTSEQLVIERLRANFPTHSIVAEESGGYSGSSDYCWYVDPLDGTTNFAHGFPMYNVSIGLEHGGELIAGVIFDPERNEMFTCERGSGAYLNNQRIHVSHVPRLDDALVATGFPSRKRHQNVNVHFFYQLAMITHGVRRAGAAALDLAYVACGRLDAFWEFGLHPWDMAAGILLVTEAGGRCSDMHGGPASLRGPHLLADNGAIHDETVGIFAEIFRGEYRHPMPAIR